MATTTGSGNGNQKRKILSTLVFAAALAWPRLILFLRLCTFRWNRYRTRQCFAWCRVAE